VTMRARSAGAAASSASVRRAPSTNSVVSTRAVEHASITRGA